MAIAGYFFVYFAFVNRAEPFVGSGTGPGERTAEFPFANSFAKTLFRPAIALDHRWQPRKWEDWGVPDTLNNVMWRLWYERPTDFERPEAQSALIHLRVTLSEVEAAQSERDCYRPHSADYDRAQKKLDVCEEAALSAYRQLQIIATKS